MKAITLHQPWATFIALGIKQYETRSWGTRYRGTIAIHAGKLTTAQIEDADAEYGDILDEYGLIAADLPSGVIVATAELVDCILMARAFVESIHRADGYEFRVGGWSTGRFAWQLDNVGALDPPVPTRGMQGLWDWDADLEADSRSGFLPRLATQKQREIIGILGRRHSVDAPLLDRYAGDLFGATVAGLTIGQASELIDRIQGWKSAPAEIERLRGQLDLFEIGGAA
jgi:hypothetical protein